jgi:hypothetical protein
MKPRNPVDGVQSPKFNPSAIVPIAWGAVAFDQAAARFGFAAWVAVTALLVTA